MRRITISLLCVAVATVAAGQKPFKTVELTHGEKPALPLAPFASTPIVTASEYVPTKGAFPIRVFRYTYRGDLEAEIKRLQKAFKKSDGWILEPRRPGERGVFERMLKGNNAVRRQAVLINSGKWVQDDKWWGRVRVDKPKGESWVRVSYNEELAIKSK